MSRLVHLVLSGAIPAAAGFAVAGPREWTRVSDGKKVSAEFAGMKDENTVSIRMANGHVFDVPLTCLAAEDAAFARQAGGKVDESGEARRPAAGNLPKTATSFRLRGVHLCCEDCVAAVARVAEKEGGLPTGVVIVADPANRTITVSAPSEAGARSALSALSEAGFYGRSDSETFAVTVADLKPRPATVDRLVVRGANLLCSGRVEAFGRAARAVPGVKSCEAQEGSGSAIIRGKGFQPAAVMRAIREAGFGGSAQ